LRKFKSYLSQINVAMRIALILVLTLVSKNILADTIEEIITILDKKDYSKVERYIEKRNSSSHCSDPGEIRKREIIAHYYEIIIPILIFIPTPPGKHIGDCTYYVINLLTNDNKVIKYEVYSKKFDDSETKNYRLIKEYSNQQELGSFQTAYKENYYRRLNLVELFDISTTYGSYCGIMGINPFRTQLEDYILSKNVEELFNWLTSPNYEKKLYAFEGYKTLIQSGYKITNNEKNQLDNLKTFKGSVRTCNGCMFMDDGFRGVLNRINNQKFDSIVRKTKVTINISSNNYKQQLPGNSTKHESSKLILIASLVFGGGLIFTVFSKRRNLSGKI